MRLLHWRDGKYELTNDLPPDGLPEYAILSHTWALDHSEEVTFSDLIDGKEKGNPRYVNKAGYQKIKFCGERAAKEGLRYFWIDTCCINKSDSSELTKSINSMFRWYQLASRCYVYLVDVSIPELPASQSPHLLGTGPHSTYSPNGLWEQAFRNSRWFKRGWTLQELLAPVSVEFFTADGHILGDKKSLEQEICEITGIPAPALQGAALSTFDIQERFRWTIGRQTTYEEDLVYCLLGIFGVFMPLIYGEGKSNAERRLNKEIADAMSGQEEVSPLPFAMIPFCRDPDFVNRGDILAQIDRKCDEPAGRVAIVGLGGVGKSQLAIEFAHQTAERSAKKWIFWVYAGTQARVEEGFRNIANAVKLPCREQPKANLLQLVYDWLSQEQNGRWIMILDNADDADLFYGVANTPDNKPLASYLPQSRNGSVLATSRNRDLARRLTGLSGIIEIGAMAEPEALALLEKKLGKTELKEGTELVRMLEYVPLAINQAAGYIRARAPRTSLGKYLADFRESERKRSRLLGHDIGDLRRDGSASNAVLTTWQISFEHIQSKRPSAADLLSLMSFFNRQGIPESLLQPVNSIVKTKRDEDSDSDSDSSDEGERMNEFEDDLFMLQDLCLITAKENKEFEMHSLVQLSTRRWLEARGLQEKFRDDFLVRMDASFPVGDFENWTVCQKLFPHVEMVVNSKPITEEVEKTWATLLSKGAWYAWQQGRYDVAEQMARKAKKSRERLLGVENIDTLSSMSLYASVIQARGQWDQAKELFIQVIDASRESLGADDPTTLANMANLATIYGNQGRWKDAEDLELQVMNIKNEKQGVDHPQTLIMMNNLALTFSAQGQWKDAEKLMEEVVEAHKKILKPDHPTVLAALTNLATIYSNQGRWKDAVKLQEEVVNARKTSEGEDHPSTLTSMNNLALTYSAQGQWKNAEELLQRVIEAREKKLGADHPDTLTSMSNLALSLSNQDKLDDAEKLNSQVMETRKRTLGADHPNVLTSMTNLALVFWKQSKWHDAEQLEVQVLEARRRKFGSDHPDTLNSMNSLAMTFWKQGRWDEAEELIQRTMEAQKTKLGPDHPNTLTSMNNLAFTWESQGRYREAISLLESCVKARQRVLGPQHPQTLKSAAKLDEWRAKTSTASEA